MSNPPAPKRDTRMTEPTQCANGHDLAGKDECGRCKARKLAIAKEKDFQTKMRKEGRGYSPANAIARRRLEARARKGVVVFRG